MKLSDHLLPAGSLFASSIKHCSGSRYVWGLVLAVLSTSTVLAGPATPHGVPTFECMSLYWDVPDGAPQKPCAVKYREAGATEWRAAQSLWFDVKKKQYRGSVVQLIADTEYEFSLSMDNNAATTVTARTWLTLRMLA